MGYYPLPEPEGVKLRSLLSFTGPASVIDACVGQGTALHLVTSDAQVRRYGVELDAERARIANENGIETIQGNAFDAIARPESFSLLYLNPPYDSEIGSIANRRMEAVFLEHTYRWLAMEGVLVLVIPFERLHDCVGILSSHFASLNVLRMTDEESVKYRQIAVLGLRRDVRGAAIENNKRQLHGVGLYGSFLGLPELQPDACPPYSVPPSGEAELSYRGLPYDLLEDLLPLSGAWKQVAQLLMPHEDVATGRPIMPLHGGHVGLLSRAS
jgi:predicted RNA methylase